MVWPARLLRVTRHGQVGAAAYAVSCICPFCASTVHFDNILEKGRTRDRDALRIGCPECSLIFDIPVRLPEKTHPTEIDAWFEQAKQQAQRGETTAALRTMLGLKNREPTHAGAWLWLGRYWIEHCTPDEAFENLRPCSGPCCLEPDVLRLLGVIFKRQGEDWLAVYYLQQAHILEKTRVPISVAGGIMHPQPTAEEIEAMDKDPVFFELGLSYTVAPGSRSV